MVEGWPPYRNTIKTQAKTVGRIVRDLMSLGGKVISRYNSNASIPPPPSPPVPEGCCCDRVVVVSKDDGTEFSTVQGAIDFIVANYTPSATAPWVVKICPGDYHEDVVGANFVTPVGLGTKKDGVRIIGVDGPTYTVPDGIHSVENILFRLEVTVVTVSPILIDAVDAPAVLNETHIFSNCQFEITSVARTGELVRVGGTGIIFENCAFVYDNTDVTLGVFTHELIKLLEGSIAEFISCNFEAKIIDVDDSLYVFSETDNEENELLVKDCRVAIVPTNIANAGQYTFYYAAGDGESKHLQDNHMEVIPTAGASLARYVYMPNAKSIVVTSNNNVVIYNNITPIMANVALTDVFNTHHDQFIDLRAGAPVLYVGLGTFNVVNSPAPGIKHITQYQDIDLPPGGSFYLPANQAGIVAGAWRIVLIRSIDWMKGGTAPVAATYRYIPGVPGIYQVNAIAHFIDATVTDGAQYRIGIAVNNTVVKYSSPHSGSAQWLGVSVSHHVRLLLPTDFINVYVWHTSGVNQTLRGTSATTGFSAHKVS